MDELAKLKNKLKIILKNLILPVNLLKKYFIKVNNKFHIKLIRIPKHVSERAHYPNLEIFFKSTKQIMVFELNCAWEEYIILASKRNVANINNNRSCYVK